MKRVFHFLFFLCFSCSLLCHGDIVLSKEGRGLYSIFLASGAGAVDRFALQELQIHLEKICGGKFPVGVSKRTIYLGMSSEAAKLLGKDNLSRQLQAQESVIQSKNGHLFLYGKGMHGNLYAVYELLENQLGCRWLNAYGDVFIPQKKTITLKEGVYRKKYSYASRALMNYFYPDKTAAFIYNYRNRQNNLLRVSPEFKKEYPGVVQELRQSGSSHILSRIIPGFKGRWTNKAEKWVPIQDYFKIHPEWFSMDEKGKRVNNRQLCFSNKALRLEVEKNALEFHRREVEQTKEKTYLMLDLNDIAYNICCCPPCAALQKKYKTPGAPFFVCLFEICKKHPEIEFLTLAYQRSLTQKPPVGLSGKIKNLTVIFAAINGDYAGTLEKQNKNDCEDLKNWRPIAKDIWVWYYPNTYSNKLVDVPVVPPVGNFERLAEDIRTMHKLGVDGSYFEHDSGGIQSGANLSEMQSYVMYKLFEDVDRDVWQLVKDFAVSYYGKAAPEIVRFARELEAGRKSAAARGIRWVYNTQDYDYLTKKNLLSWDELLKKAARKVSGEEAFKVAQTRMGLDCVIIWKLWDKKQDALLKECADRLVKTAAELKRRNRPGAGKLVVAMDQWLKRMYSRSKDKPLPEEFAKLPANDVIVVLPRSGGSAKYNAEDPEANRGIAKTETWNGKYLGLGTYDPAGKKYGPGRRIYAKDIKKGKYALYKVADNIVLTPTLFMWGGQWNLHLPLGKYCRHDDLQSLTRKWTLYVSLKFTDDRVYLDRGFLVSKEKK